MTSVLTSADLLARLRSGVHAAPSAVEIDWRSCFGDRPVLETGFGPETGADASSDDAALCGDDLTKFRHDERGPWRDSYVIRPAAPHASSAAINPSTARPDQKETAQS